MSSWMNRAGRVAGGPGKEGVDPFEANFNMGLAQPLSRSVRLNGFATCLRLEEVYWRILERIAEVNQCSVNAVLSYVDREVHLRYGGVKNFSGLIRVVCVVFLLGTQVTR
ncbi:ribbon-helix-helix domain-containing protein [Pseudomonas sp. 210_17 TE3656]